MRNIRDLSLYVEPSASRRSFLLKLGLAIPGIVSLSAWTKLSAAFSERALSFHHLHTGEHLSLIYTLGNHLVPESLRQIDHFLRDFRTDEVHKIDPQLLDTLYMISSIAGNRGTFEVISGYRSPSTNAMLSGKSAGVAKKSLHMQGRAIDVRLTGVDTARLRKIAISLKRGGIGYYPKSDFVHLDTGRLRSW